ncbi:MAG: PAS domain S-box protein [Plectolyngbya sp. WJT66-NPBG17]|jgi:PAS domain S-box-containing protein|nr:PAS domain S-box protein [Plectolyngbya sp. WJT66-NPBG17]
MDETLDPNCPELISRIRVFKTQVQEFQRAIEDLPHPIQPSIEQSLSTVLTQLETALNPQSASLLIATHHTEEQWLALSDCLPFGIFSCDVQGQVTYINSRCAEIVGHTLEESIGNRWLSYVHLEDRDRILSPWIEDAKAGRPHRDQFRVITFAQEVRWLNVRTAPMFSEQGELTGHTGTIEDITIQKLTEEQIQASLEEKEALLKEIHHRVKNNLQIISSLIYLQAQRIDDPKVRQIFEDSQSRISSMALVHDSLYRSQDFARVNLSEYVQTLTSSLFHTYRVQPEAVNLAVNVDPDVVVSLEKAIPCGLILNELMTNALKHGFIGEETGEVTVTLFSHCSQVCLMVENDGKILPESFELQKIRSMGLRLVNALVDQLNGQVAVEKSQKTRFKVTFDCA